MSSPSRSPRPSISVPVRRWARATLMALPLALAFGALYAWRNPQHPTPVAVLVMAALTWPILAVAVQMFVVERHKTDADLAAHADDVERAWANEAGATAFATLMGGLVFFEYVGEAFRLSWLSPVGLVHVLVLGGVTFVASYLWLRTRGR